MYEFDAIQRGVRIHSGRDALDALPREIGRLRAERVFLVCGRSVAEKTGLLDRVRGLLGHRLVGVYAGIRKDAPVSCVEAAAAAAVAAGADVLLAVGAGSVIKAVRVIAMLLAERLPLQDLCTQYPAGTPPVSPKLLADKVPIINILTAPTSAQNRGGSALKDDRGGARLEFFDPKTRPAAIFWDAEALMSAPEQLVRSTGFSVYWRALMNIGSVEQANPLVQGDRLQAFHLARRSLFSSVASSNYGARIDLCAAALLQNRDEDDGGRPFDTHRIARVVYALAAPIFHQHEAIDQASAHAALTPAAIRVHGHRCVPVIRAIGHAVCHAPDVSTEPTPVALAVEREFLGLGMKTRLRDLGLRRDDLRQVLAQSQRNFNADRTGEFRDEAERAALEATLEFAW